ncbi:hypothetical protein IMSAGC004_03363 [Bacteroidaceae bacterium]|nr:hypothetical protein IMSAGC004_03363 [Bacteroidaceae bacterium]
MKLKNTVRLSHLYPSVKLLDVYDELFAYDAKTNLLTWINDKKENNIENTISKIKHIFEPSPPPQECGCGCAGCIWEDGGSGFSVGIAYGQM